MAETDRELLEKAARAAGYHVSFTDGCTLVDGADTYYMHDRGWPHPDREGSHWWNPLADDGDALRLAVKLQIDMMHFDKGVNTGVRLEFVELYNSDPYAATRRAIVRAAAAMGDS